MVPILGDKDGDGVTGTIEIQKRHINIIYAGLGLYVKRLQAFKGTATPLGFTEAALDAVERAQYIETILQVKFAEQGELLPAEPIAGNGELPPPPPASEVEGMRSQAEALADPQ